jgi:hypothetical protein
MALNPPVHAWAEDSFTARPGWEHKADSRETVNFWSVNYSTAH